MMPLWHQKGRVGIQNDASLTPEREGGHATCKTKCHQFGLKCHQCNFDVDCLSIGIIYIYIQNIYNIILQYASLYRLYVYIYILCAFVRFLQPMLSAALTCRST